MKRLDLNKIDHSVKRGEVCPPFTPNITEDTIFYEDGKPIGFYMKTMPEKCLRLFALANLELLSKRVPKSKMSRVLPMGEDENGRRIYERVDQYSTILGACPSKPHMRRPYPTKSSVHGHASAENFIKAMYLGCVEAEKLVKEYLPDQYALQKQTLSEIKQTWKVGDLFTSSISNFNISANFHRDTANIPNTVNIIITKRDGANGGCLHVPDYNATIEQCDNSILVYPAWKSLHGVTPIELTKKGGYRNSLVFYPLKEFLKYREGEG